MTFENEIRGHKDLRAYPFEEGDFDAEQEPKISL